MKSEILKKKPQMHSLYSIKNRKAVKVVSINSECDAKTRLSHLSIILGTEIVILSAVPFKGPIQIKFRDAQLCIRRGLAEKIIVEEICAD